MTLYQQIQVSVKSACNLMRNTSFTRAVNRYLFGFADFSVIILYTYPLHFLNNKIIIQCVEQIQILFFKINRIVVCVDVVFILSVFFQCLYADFYLQWTCGCIDFCTMLCVPTRVKIRRWI